MGRDSEAHCSSNTGTLGAGSASIRTFVEITSCYIPKGNTG